MIDLKRTAGDRYRIETDPSAQEDTGRAERLWLWRVSCRYGFIGVHGDGLLLAHCGSSRLIAKLLCIPGVTQKQRGDAEVNCTFPPDRLDEVAEVLGARKRRRLTPEQREAGTRRLEAYQFARTSGRETAPI